MEQIIFFTTFLKMRDIEVSVDIPEAGFMEFNSRTTNSTNRIIILDETSLKNNLNLFDGYSNYLVFHNQTLKNEMYQEIINSTKYKLEDHHIKGGSKIYHQINTIKDGFDDTKFEELKKTIINIKLEAALDFLHDCLVKKPDIKFQLQGFDLDKACTMDKTNGKTINTLYSDFLKDTKNYKLLDALRDGVLEMAEIK